MLDQINKVLRDLRKSELLEKVTFNPHLNYFAIKLFLNDQLRDKIFKKIGKILLSVAIKFQSIMGLSRWNVKFRLKTHQSYLSSAHAILAVFFAGAYGTAILYRKKDDDSLVILKEINLHDLNASERQLALNEVTLFI